MESEKVEDENPSIENNEESTSMTEDILPGYKTMEEFTKDGYKSIMEATRSSNRFPADESWDFYSTFTGFEQKMDVEGKHILKLISKVLHHQGIKPSILKRDIDEKFELVVDANDTILERVGSNLDEISGIRRNPEPILVESFSKVPDSVGSWNNKHMIAEKNSRYKIFSKLPPTVNMLTAKNIIRPQVNFKDKINNDRSPFEPRIKDKPNSLKPLAILVEMSEHGECYSHPYEYELTLFKVPESQLVPVTPQDPRPLHETPLVMVEHEDDLKVLMSDLSQVTEFAVDLEHHSYRSFMGFTCLMQISTRDKDYLIDTLSLRDKLHCLNEYFTKPTIVKVFHGAYMDIDWLQRDLCLYVVNMFDTHFAAKALNFSRFSLAHLLKHYVNVTANKQYQLSDWRIRPLPDDLKKYAREDTHYLLYVYDQMRNELLQSANGEQNKLLSVLQQSTDICKKRYVKPTFTEDSHLDHYRRTKRVFDNRQLYALKELFAWRDKTARQEDESLGYVLPSHMLLHICDTLPREMQGILACCNPIPPLVRQNLIHLHQVVLKAREQPLVKPVFEEEGMRSIPTQGWLKGNLDGVLHCPHDQTRLQDFREDLPTLLGHSWVSIQPPARGMINNTPIITVFDCLVDMENDSDDATKNSWLVERAKKITFVSPYERYKKVRPFAHSLEQPSEVTETPDKDADHLDNSQEIAEPDTEVTHQTENVTDSLKSEPQASVVTEGIEEDVPLSKAKSSKPAKVQSQKSTDSTFRNQKGCKKRKIKCKMFEDQMTKTVQGVTTDKPAQKDSVHKEAMAEEQQGPSQHVGIKNTWKKEKNKIKKLKKGAFQPFDYSQVNFGRFQGGSKQHQAQNASTESKFKPKGKKTKFTGKSNHKSQTFGKRRGGF